MDEDKIANALFSNPDEFFELLESNNFDYSGLKKLDIPKLLVRERYKDLISQDHFDAAESVLWISYFVEREITEDIFYIETKLSKNNAEIDEMLDKMTFGEKIKFVEDNYVQKKDNDLYVSVLRSVKTLRNHMAHGRLDKLKYGKYSLSDPRGQMKLTIDLMNAARNKNTGSIQVNKTT